MLRRSHSKLGGERRYIKLADLVRSALFPVFEWTADGWAVMKEPGVPHRSLDAVSERQRLFKLAFPGLTLAPPRFRGARRWHRCGEMWRATARGTIISESAANARAQLARDWWDLADRRYSVSQPVGVSLIRQRDLTNDLEIHIITMCFMSRLQVQVSTVL